MVDFVDDIGTQFKLPDEIPVFTDFSGDSCLALEVEKLWR